MMTRKKEKSEREPLTSSIKIRAKDSLQRRLVCALSRSILNREEILDLGIKLASELRLILFPECRRYCIGLGVFG